MSYRIDVDNFNADADFIIWWKENNIENAIEDRFSFQPIGQSLPLEGLPEGLRCIGVPVTINSEGDVEIRLLLADFFLDDAPDTLPPLLVGDGETPNDPVVVTTVKKDYGSTR